MVISLSTDSYKNNESINKSWGTSDFLGHFSGLFIRVLNGPGLGPQPMGWDSMIFCGPGRVRA